MKVLVIGAGEVGSSIARSLSESHEVTVMDVDSDRVDTLTYELDVLAIEGDGTDIANLREAGVTDADMVIASTDGDETNLAVCGSVKAISDAFTIARVKRRTYLDTWQSGTDVFGVDFMVCTDLLTAQSIARIIGLPTAIDVELFADGAVQMAEFEVPAGSPVAGETVREADRFDGLTFAGIATDNGIEVPQGDSRIEAGSRVIVIGRPPSVRSFAAAVTPRGSESGDNVVIFGGGTVGVLLAELLQDRGLVPRLVEVDGDRAREIAERLPDTTVIEHDATDREFMEREEIGDADVVVATLDSDERNLLVSLLASGVGAGRTVALVDDGSYVDTFEAVGVDVAVNPRKVAAEEVTRFTRETRTENVAIVESDRAEVLEIAVEEDSILAGRSVSESIPELPAGVVLGALTREEEVIIPRGDTVIQPGDHVIVFVETENIDAAVDQL